MAKFQILFTRVLEGERDVSKVEEEINRVLSNVEGEIISLQVEELQKDGEYKLYLLIK